MLADQCPETVEQQENFDRQQLDGVKGQLTVLNKLSGHTPKSEQEAQLMMSVYLRRMKELSQTDLGRATNVSFQQIQKYERGLNRISVGFNSTGNNIEAVQPIFAESR